MFHLLRLIPHLIFMSGWAGFGRAGSIRYRLDCLVVLVGEGEEEGIVAMEETYLRG